MAKNFFPISDKELKKKINKLPEELKELILNLYNAAIRDEKTGLYNHRFLETILEMEIEKAKRGQEDLCLVMIDIDDFKKVNEIYGHFKADELLSRLAKVMTQVVRKSDVVSRFGGEEFLMILPETNLEKAKMFSERLKGFIHKDSILSKFNIKVSGGISQYKKSESSKQFKERANRALHQAKKQGKDRFVSAK